MFSYVDIEARVPGGHPLWRIRERASSALGKLDEPLCGLHAQAGRSSIPLERVIHASLLQLPYSIRSERQVKERMEFDRLFWRFVGLGIDDPVWDHSVLSKNRDRLLTTDIAQEFLAALLADPKVKRLLSQEHFSVDGTLLKAWASMKSFQTKDGGGNPSGGGRNGERDFRGEMRSNETHASTADADARLYRKGKGQESRLCYTGHAIMENRNGLAVSGEVTHATETAEREAASSWVEKRRGKRHITLRGDKAYDVFDFIATLKERYSTPHIAANGNVRWNGVTHQTAIDRRTTCQVGYSISQCIRKRIEEIFGSTKAIGGLTQVKVHGPAKVNLAFIFGVATYDLIRLPKLLAVAI